MRLCGYLSRKMRDMRNTAQTALVVSNRRNISDT
jgi:hypothetical protein